MTDDPTPLTLRRTDLDTAAGGKVENDYCVWCDGQVVGRIRKTNAYGTEEWFWTNNRFPNSMADRGYAPSLEAAKAAFRARWERQ